ncbi:MAG: DUF3768 domain-containing protein [Candidatus Poribacteria bacterium]|nr:DUF3768 domain-containing protein [Candidatus Poribacteria bacterium]
MQTIQAQNDAFRRGMFVNLDKPNKAKPAGCYAVSAGVHALPPDEKAQVLAAVRNFNNFTEDNDPCGEHEFGNIELPNIPEVFWRIDYYADGTWSGAQRIQRSRVIGFSRFTSHQNIKGNTCTERNRRNAKRAGFILLFLVTTVHRHRKS